jgi:hypothetical protein
MTISQGNAISSARRGRDNGMLTVANGGRQKYYR